MLIFRRCTKAITIFAIASFWCLYIITLAQETPSIIPLPAFKGASHDWVGRDIGRWPCTGSNGDELARRSRWYRSRQNEPRCSHDTGFSTVFRPLTGRLRRGAHGLWWHEHIKKYI